CQSRPAVSHGPRPAPSISLAGSRYVSASRRADIPRTRDVGGSLPPVQCADPGIAHQRAWDVAQEAYDRLVLRAGHRGGLARVGVVERLPHERVGVQPEGAGALLVDTRALVELGADVP